MTITNTGPVDLTAGDLTATVPVQNAGYQWQGFGGRGWDYGVPASTGTSLNFAYYSSIPAGGRSELIYAIIKNSAPGQTPPPTATFVFSAPNFAATPAALSIVY
ncbi:hypothetical protein [Nocardioides alkalitolerans]|uniref:hypothetical protein n=1 Tax=Nocardioides alkalitolerans TaxID=281714 RepID=UPI0012FA93F3|nr:hypothetical protein [Nocardioides alkalitolerans]